MIRFGAPLPAPDSPEAWVKTVREQGYNAAYVPLTEKAGDTERREYRQAAEEADILLAETGAWSNLVSPDRQIREAAFRLNVERLRLAEDMGARCCVNVTGSKGEYWCGADPGNYAAETYDEIVEVIRRVIDEVQPVQTYYTVEFMQWAIPDSTDSYLSLIRDVERDRFAVHLDPVNILNSPEKYYKNGDVIRDAFRRMGPYLRSCHAKDITMTQDFLVHISETPIGTGILDYRTYLEEISRYPDVPLMLEHLPDQAAYRKAAQVLRGRAREWGFELPE